MDGLHAREVVRSPIVPGSANVLCVLGHLESNGEGVCRLLEGNTEDERWDG
jgi:hypothetical protein